MIDPARIMERLRRLHFECESEMQPTNWRVVLHVTAICYPNDGSGGTITFTVSTEPVEDDDE